MERVVTRLYCGKRKRIIEVLSSLCFPIGNQDKLREEYLAQQQGLNQRLFLNQLPGPPGGAGKNGFFPVQAAQESTSVVLSGMSSASGNEHQNGRKNGGMGAFPIHPSIHPLGPHQHSSNASGYQQGNPNLAPTSPGHGSYDPNNSMSNAKNGSETSSNTFSNTFSNTIANPRSRIKSKAQIEKDRKLEEIWRGQLQEQQRRMDEEKHEEKQVIQKSKTSRMEAKMRKAERKAAWRKEIQDRVSFFAGILYFCRCFLYFL